MKYIITKISGIFFSILLFTVYFNYSCNAADINDLYQAFLEKDRYLYKGEIYHFRANEDGVHGGVSYDKFDSNFYFYSFNNVLRFSPASSLELALGFKEIFPVRYKRLTYNPSGSLAILQRYKINYCRDYSLSLRMRKERVEIYQDFLGKRQKTNWNSANYPAMPNYFSYIRAHYEHFKTGLRYLSDDYDIPGKSNLSKLRRSLLSDNQINIEAELEYRKGKLRRNTSYYSAGLYSFNFYQTLRKHLIPGLNLRYGLTENLEMESGLYYTTPFNYEYEYKEYWPAGTTFLTTGTYKLDNNFRVPLKLRFRPKAHFEIELSSDSRFIDQQLDCWKKDTGGTTTVYPSKKLTYYNTQPAITLTYLHDDNKEIQKDEFSSLTKELLLKGQFLVEFHYQKDLTHLNKNSSNGALNSIDPYNVFLYPQDYFVAGTEYAVFFTGNTSRFAANVHLQNYYLGHLVFSYGITDNFNAGFRLGYHSSSSLHHFTLYDLKDRFYKFKPYNFFDVICEWRVNKNSIISFNSHFVPDYTTYLIIEDSPKEYKSKTRYLEVSLALEILF